MRKIHGTTVIICAALTSVCPAGETFTFQEISAAQGVSGYVMAAPGQGGGVIAADYDNDGDIDLFAPTDNGTPDRLYQNQGDGTFVDVAAALGVASMTNNRAALWFDYDGDGDLDLLVARDGYLDLVQLPTQTLLFYRYDADAGVYVDVTAAAGLSFNMLNDIPTHIGGLCAGDINNDGYLEFMMTQWRGEHYLFYNNKNGTFTNIGVSSGVSNGLDNPREESWQPIMFDVNNDGWLDIFVCVDKAPNKLFINNHNLTFTDGAPAAGVDSAWNEMGIALADFNGDGKVDMYITNIDRFDGVQRHNVLYRNDTVGAAVAFTDVSVAMGVDHGYFGWGTTFIDGDRDTFVDIAEVNGVATNPLWNSYPSRFFRNNGMTFDDVSAAVNFAQINSGSALNAFDCDRDGDLDLVQTCAGGCTIMLLDNVQAESSDNHYIVVKPRMDCPNYFAIGAEVKVVASGRTQVRVITAGTSYLGQEPAEAFFGLAGSATVSEISIKWPSGGGATTLNNVSADQVITINHYRCPGDINELGSVDIFDLFALLAEWNTDGSANPRTDIDSSGVVDVFDLFIMLDNWGDCP